MPTPSQLIGARVVLLLAIGGINCSPSSRQRAPIISPVAIPAPQRVELARGGWRLVADLQRPVPLAQRAAVPAVLLLNKAAGSRTAYMEHTR